VSVREYLFDPEKYIRKLQSYHDIEIPKSWSTIAVTALALSAYIPLIDSSFAEFYSETLGIWWSDDPKGMYKFKDGMEALPNAFVAPYNDGKYQVNLSEKIRYQFYVTKVDYSTPDKVVVTGITGNGKECTVEGSRILLTVSLTIMKNIIFNPALPSPKADALTGITYCPSTKILLLFKERFWERDDRGQNPILGGFSKTTDTLGQLHYPTNPVGANPKQRGVLVSYTWERNALVFGAEKKTFITWQSGMP